METIPVPYAPGMRFVQGFQSADGGVWLSTKLNIASLPSSSRLFIEVLGEKAGKDYEGLCDVILASVCVQLCDHTGRMIHGRRSLKLWSEVDVPAREVGHTCPTPWSSTTALDGAGGSSNKGGGSGDGGNGLRPSSVGSSAGGSGGGGGVIDEEALRRKMALMMSGTMPTASRPRPTVHLTFDRFVAPIMWNANLTAGDEKKKKKSSASSGSSRRDNKKKSRAILRHQSSVMSFIHHGSVPDMDGDDGEDLNIEMSGLLEVEKSSKWGGRKKWKEYWAVLEESTGTLSWFSSKRTDAKCLGCVELAGVDVCEYPNKSRAYKKGKGTTLKDAETVCFKVDITSEERNLIKGKHGNSVLYFAHVSRREVRAWMDAIAKVGLTQSERLEDLEEQRQEDRQHVKTRKS